MNTAFQHYNAQIHPDLTETMFLSFTQHYNMSGFHRLTFDTCAVVGSSSTLLKVKDGDVIDNHTVVFRVNGFPFQKKLQAFTGKKTSITFTSNAKVSDGRTVVYCLVPWVGSCWWDTKHDHHPRLSPGFVKYVKQRYNLKKWPSTGLMAVAFAQTVCNTIDTFGFGIDPLFSNCSHYYNVNLKTHARCIHPKRVFYRNTQRNYNSYKDSYWHELIKESKIIKPTMFRFFK